MFVHAVNLKRRIAVLDDGTQLPITYLFDAHGEMVDDADEASTFVCGISGMWFHEKLADFEGGRMN